MDNIAKHGVAFETAHDFDWETATGKIGDRLYVLVYTVRADTRRIISMRKANRREMRRYGQLENR
ncbi:MAG: BrnT family toxin [Pseudomonadota bacterium]